MASFRAVERFAAIAMLAVTFGYAAASPLSTHTFEHHKFCSETDTYRITADPLRRRTILYEFI
jgi:hypothetical protein